ncbi:MAG: rhomboid family intramembrane serine protease [Chitinophagaceae bacterium]|nr:rhomboid family intramembrane serine protease [Chitinophagaceae bacterium]
MMQRTTPIVLNLIIINVIVYLAQRTITAFDVTDWGGLHYFFSPGFKPHQLITHMFMHDSKGFGHLFFNMFALWMFGTTLENYVGSKKFLVFYLISGLGAAVLTQFTIPFSAEAFAKSADGVQTALTNNATMAQVVEAVKDQYLMVGASGAIMGVMVAFAYLFPNTEMYMMFIPIPVKAKFVIPVFILIDLFGGLNQTAGDNVAHFAHLGGALVGFLLIFFWNKTNRKTFY